MLYFFIGRRIAVAIFKFPKMHTILLSFLFLKKLSFYTLCFVDKQQHQNCFAPAPTEPSNLLFPTLAKFKY